MVRLRVSTLAPYEVTWADGLPVTTALRTLTDLLADGAEAGEAGGFLAEALDRRMLRVENVIPELARFAHRYGCPDGDGQALVRALIDQAAATQPACGIANGPSPTWPASCCGSPTTSCGRSARWPARPGNPPSWPCSPGSGRIGKTQRGKTRGGKKRPAGR